MPPNKNLERLIGTAVVDREFRAVLLRSPLSAAQGFDLSSDELDILRGACTDTLEDLAAHVHAWVMKAPAHGRPSSSRRLAGDSLLARVAV
ncbi:MAG TPA: Franean1_4349 family RiPP [Chloroflexota bacterium]|nr:Franean1_4349 family RiPP [Chloroflexota bacterium]